MLFDRAAFFVPARAEVWRDIKSAIHDTRVELQRLGGAHHSDGLVARACDQLIKLLLQAEKPNLSSARTKLDAAIEARRAIERHLSACKLDAEARLSDQIRTLERDLRTSRTLLKGRKL